MDRILSDITVDLEHSSTSAEAPLGVWAECNVSSLVRMAVRLEHGPEVVETMGFIDGITPYLSWEAPGFIMTLTRLATGALEIEEHEAY